MNRAFKILIIICTLFIWASISFGKIKIKTTAPIFSLNSIDKKTYNLETLKNKSMVVLYFFDIDSRPSQEGLLSLERLISKHKNADLVIWAITRSPLNKIKKFLSKTRLSFPILLDDSNVSALYNAEFILPTMCILGPKLIVLDHLQGGGKTVEIMLLRLAERQLQKKEIKLAKTLSEEVVKKNPSNIKAKVLKGYAALKEGNLEKAERIFKEVCKQPGGEILGKEGLAAVYAKKGNVKEALNLANEVEKKAPQRAYVHVIKGDIFYSEGKTEKAKQEYELASKKKEAEPYQAAIGFNKLGRLYAKKGEYERARELYEQAVEIDPYYIEAMTNKGLTYEKEGKWDKALKSYQQALSLRKNDNFAFILAKKAQEMLELQRDIARKKRMDHLIKELVKRYKEQKKEAKKQEDTWTSRPMIISFVEFEEKGGLSERDGFSQVLVSQLGDYLNSSGRVKVVERAIMEKLLEELNIGSSELADPNVTLKLGKILAAKLLGTGAIYFLPNVTLLNLRFIDTETSSIPLVITRKISFTDLQQEIRYLNREILKNIITKYPLRGYIVQVEENQVIINIGSKQGVILGTKFNIIEEGKIIKFKGRLLKAQPKVIGQIEVIKVEPDLSYAKILTKKRALKSEDKIIEIIGI